jgi:lipoic acid synthetase
MRADSLIEESFAVRDCGLTDFQETLREQLRLVEQRRNGQIGDTVLLTEHQPVITLGARLFINKLLITPEALAEQDIAVVQIRRGGGTTAHNPGQIVFYPILGLRGINLSVGQYIRELEAIGNELLEQLGVCSERREGLPGLWVGDKKIGFIGVRVTKGVTYHGMSINIQNDLGIFDYIVPCGLEGLAVTSVLAETGREYSIAEVKQRLTGLLEKHFANEGFVENRPGMGKMSSAGKLAPWLRRRLPAGGDYERTANVLSSLGLETICVSANCPNRGECWSRGTATVLILGNICTRNCRFCSVTKDRPSMKQVPKGQANVAPFDYAQGKLATAKHPQPPDATEPERIAKMVKQMGLRYLVITSVTRDDLPDGGAGHFRDCIKKVRSEVENVNFEILTPDFNGCQEKAIEILGEAGPFVFGHNIETVGELYPTVRPGADYRRSLRLLELAGQSYPDMPIKSSIMLGLGESDEQVKGVLEDLRRAGCSRIVIGQYLRPSRDALPVVNYVEPARFDYWKQEAKRLGFSWVLASPFARSSFLAEMEQIS